MARKMQRLSVKTVESKKAPGYYADGGGLYLQVSSSGTKSWLFRFMLRGRAREMGLGSCHTVTLAQARARAVECRVRLEQGIDPIEARKAEKAQGTMEAAKVMTFQQCGDAYVKAHRADWKNAKHADQWESTLTSYCGPVFGTVPVQAIDTALVLKALEPIWTEKAETASRLRARIERVLDWATVRGYRTGDNPARWRGHLDKLLPKLEKRKRVKHHPALPFPEIGTFMASLRQHEGFAARALELLIVTATRTSEILLARWSEFDLNAGLWTIPAERMKAHREHRVPLSQHAAKILRELEAQRVDDFLFPGQKPGKPMSNMAMAMLLDRMGRDDITVHGFRSTFRDWASERTSYPREVCEMALAHAVSDQTEAAYRRGDLFDKRRRLMQEWAKFCDTPKQPGKVLHIRKRRAGV